MPIDFSRWTHPFFKPMKAFDEISNHFFRDPKK
jgi:hypothetical protein